MKPSALAILLIIFALSACQPVIKRKAVAQENKLNQLTWMLGKWEMETPDGKVTEEWQKPSDTQWQGVSYMVTSAGDTSFQEHIRLHYLNDTLYYLPTITSQNDGKEASFKETALSDSLIVFENIKHDFPQKITYKRMSDTTIIAAIEGTQNGQMRREEFVYQKRK